MNLAEYKRSSSAIRTILGGSSMSKDYCINNLVDNQRGRRRIPYLIRDAKNHRNVAIVNPDRKMIALSTDIPFSIQKEGWEVLKSMPLEVGYEQYHNIPNDDYALAALTGQDEAERLAEDMRVSNSAVTFKLDLGDGRDRDFRSRVFDSFINALCSEVYNQIFPQVRGNYQNGRYLTLVIAQIGRPALQRMNYPHRNQEPFTTTSSVYDNDDDYDDDEF